MTLRVYIGILFASSTPVVLKLRHVTLQVLDLQRKKVDLYPLINI